MTIRKRKSYKNQSFLFNNGSVMAVDSGSKGDDDASYTSVYSGKGILYLGKHATADGSISLY